MFRSFVINAWIATCKTESTKFRILVVWYADKELTNLELVLASDWLTNISVCDFVWQKEIQRKKSQNEWQNSSPFINPWS